MNRHASMNRIYRLVWSQVRSAWVPVAETARGRGKAGRARVVRAAAAALSLALVPLAHASPTGGQVISGTGSITQSGNTTDIRQSSQNLSINWQSFNIGPQQTVDFLQPNSSSIAVNRIFSVNGSQILGHLDANGQVYLINPNGIVFGKGAQVNVGGLVASTLDLNDASFIGSARSFSDSALGSIVNQGTISAAKGGYVALLGNHVSNEGVITAQSGTVALGAGSAVTLTFNGNRLVHLQVDRSVLKSLAENHGLIEADGGQVLMTAGAKDALLASVVNNTGVIEARTVENHEGTITLLGGMTAGTVNVAGTLDASAANGGNGGQIETSAAHVEVANDTRVTTAASKGLTGSWLIDPNDFTVAASGGDITGATLSTNLASTAVTLQSSSGATAGSGNVNVNDTVSWSANTALTLTASNNVNVNSSITASGATAGLVINPNTANGTETASGTGTLNVGAGASITLSGANAGLSISTSSYTLGAGATINLPNVSPTSTTALVIGGTPYTVINSLGAAGSSTGTDLQGINGNLSGYYALGSNIDGTATSSWNSGAGFTPIGNPTTQFTGMFDGLGHTISNLIISLPTSNYVGLFGVTGTGFVIRNVGLVGGSVSGYGNVGGLVGNNYYGTISNSYATSSVSGTNSVGGLVGFNEGGTISNSYATGSVSGSGTVGGMVGINYYGSISNSYATGSVSGSGTVGGMVGYNEGTVSNSYATGSVSGTNGVGGLVGYNAGTVSYSYSTGRVSGSSYVGGLMGGGGKFAITIYCYWDWQTSGQLKTLGGGTGLSTARMQNASSFTDWSIATTGGSGDVWRIYQGHTFPLLTSFLTPLTLTDTTATYNGSTLSGATGGVLGTPAIGINAGTYNPYSTQQGYDITGGNLTINPASLTLSGSRAYDGTTTVAGRILTATGVAGQTFSVTGAGDPSNLASPNVQTNSTLASLMGLNLGSSSNGGLSSNYYPLSTTGSSVTITRRPSVAWVGGTTGNWSNAANWAGGAIPDYANVAAVTIPSGTTVTYDSGVPGATALTTLADSGNLVMAAGNLSTTGNLSTAGYQQTGGQLNVGGTLSITSTAGAVILSNIIANSLNIDSSAGAITQAASTALSVTGAARLTADNGVSGAADVKYDITLANATNNFVGRVTSNGLNINLLDSAGGLILGNTTDTAALTVTSRAGAITQAAGTAVNVTGATSLIADNGVTGAGDVKYGITLGNAANNFGGTVNSNGLNISLLDTSTNGLILGNTTATGTLTDISRAGAITQAASTAVNVTGATSLTAYNGLTGASAVRYGITLANPTDNFVGAVTSYGLNINLLDSSAGGLLLGNTTATGTLTATSRAGAITQAAATAARVTGATTLTADNGGTGTGDVKYNVTLANATNNFGGAVTTNGANINLADGTGGITLGNTTASGTLGNPATGTLTVTSLNGNITQATGTAINANGSTNLTADNGVSGAGDLKYNVTLANTGNNFVSAVNSNGLNINLADATGGITLGNTTATGTFTVTSRGAAIRQLAGTSINVSGASTLTGDNGVSGAGDVRYNISLASTTDRFGGAVTAVGGTISLYDTAALTAALTSVGAVSLTSAGPLFVSGTIGTNLTTVTTGGTSSTTTFGNTTVGSYLKVTSTGAVTEALGTELLVNGAGTDATDPANIYVTVNGVAGAVIQ